MAAIDSSALVLSLAVVSKFFFFSPLYYDSNKVGPHCESIRKKTTSAFTCSRSRSGLTPPTGSVWFWLGLHHYSEAL